MFAFTSTARFEIAGRGTVYSVPNPVRCDDFSHLIGHQVKIDDAVHKVIGVERFAHAPPWREGEDISLLVAAESLPPFRMIQENYDGSDNP